MYCTIIERYIRISWARLITFYRAQGTSSWQNFGDQFNAVDKRSPCDLNYSAPLSSLKWTAFRGFRPANSCYHCWSESHPSLVITSRPAEVLKRLKRMAPMNSLPILSDSDNSNPLFFTGQNDFRLLFQFEEGCPEGLLDTQMVKKLIRALKGGALAYYVRWFCKNTDYTKT